MADEAKIVVDQELIENYARVKQVSLEEARRKLEENLTKEASVDLRQQMTTLMNAFRKMSPQLNGVILRESDVNVKLGQLGNEIAQLTRANEELQKRLDFERETYKKAMILLNNIVAEDTKTLARIAALEASSVPLYKRILNRIKCLLNN
jgi:hypothetical protein